MFETVQGEYLPLCTLDRTRCCRSALWRHHGMILPRYGPHTRLIKISISWSLYGKANPSVLIGSFLVGISPYGLFPWKRSWAVYFLFSNAGKFKTSMARVLYNKLLTNQASSSRTGKYWPSVVFVRTSHCHDLGPIFPSTALALG